MRFLEDSELFSLGFVFSDLPGFFEAFLDSGRAEVFGKAGASAAAGSFFNKVLHAHGDEMYTI